MESLNSYIIRKMKLRKIMMIIFSACSILLICGILNTVQESESENGGNIDNQEIMISKPAKTTPREILFEQKDRKLRIYSAITLLTLMAVSFLIDMLFVRCPACSGHIQYTVTPEACRNCGCSFVRKENEK